MSPAPTAPARWRRKRPRVVVLLTTALCCLPSVAGFGFSGVGALSPTRTAAADAALVRARGQSRTEWTKKRRAHDITCKVSSPRRYGSADWFSNIQNLPKSRLLYNIKGHLFYNTAFAFSVSMVHLLTPQHVIDDMHVSAIPHSIMSGALGLLLVFRTNAAYNRFWEARKIWGGLINTCRNIARLSSVALGPDSEEWQEMKEYVRMFPFLLKQHLQDTREDSELDWVSLPKEDILRLQEDPNPPMFACQKMTEILAVAFSDGGGGQSKGGRVPDFTSVTYRMEIERNLSSLMDALGMCERILTTPVPRGYSRHTSRFLTVYGFTLPIVLVPHTELFTAPVVAAVCWGLFSIEEIAYFIEQPFDPEYRQLDLMGFSEKVARDVERITVSSSLGRQGPSASPRLPGATAGVNGGLLTYQLADGNNGHAGVDNHNHNHNGFEGRWGTGADTGLGGSSSSSSDVNGRGGGEGGGAAGKDGRSVVKPKGVDGLSKSWRGSPDDDIIGG